MMQQSDQQRFRQISSIEVSEAGSEVAHRRSVLWVGLEVRFFQSDKRSPSSFLSLLKVALFKKVLSLRCVVRAFCYGRTRSRLCPNSTPTRWAMVLQLQRHDPPLSSEEPSDSETSMKDGGLVVRAVFSAPTSLAIR
mmetsp:Transcript_53981/g.127472  ORF Transcript_53981/g.127472 Transcript_53981/m.127472 type:complete len:137 (-) Transcript_53981:833-1243(-)